jgi:hypothetical protein
MKASHKELSDGEARALKQHSPAVAAGPVDEFNRSKKCITVNLLF